VTPSATTSARPPTRVATTGVPAAIASASTVPNGSWREGATSTSRWRMTAAPSGTHGMCSTSSAARTWAA
jgi:hypothetical protein